MVCYITGNVITTAEVRRPSLRNEKSEGSRGPRLPTVPTPMISSIIKLRTGRYALPVLMGCFHGRRFTVRVNTHGP